MPELNIPPFPALDHVIELEDTLIERRLDESTVRIGARRGRLLIEDGGGHAISVRWHAGLALEVEQRVVRIVPEEERPTPWTTEMRARLLAVALRTPNTVARILPNTKGRDAELYGLVSGGRFQPTDKRAVRHEYHRTLARFGIAADRPRYGHRAGAPTESYPLPDLSGRTRSSVELKYGLDNGASGYRLSLSDIEVVVCSNGLTYDVLREGAIRWRHVRGEPVETFLTDGLEALFTWRGRLEDSMTLAEEREADGTARQWADRALPQGADPTERHRILRAVADRHQVETARHGDTAWAVSQALSWVGTHELRGLDGWRLRRAATEVLLSA